MEFRQMQYFLCLTEEKSVTRAARQLNIVQPALSMQIAKLEAELGQKLFERSIHGMALTVAGEALARLVSPIVRDVEYAKQEMAQLNGRISGRVSVGLITSVAQSTMASSSATVAHLYPEITLSACEGYTETLTDWVNSGQLDFALINVPRRRVSLAAHHIMDEEMVLACRKDAPIRPPTKLRFGQLAEFDLVMPSKRHGLRMILEEHAATAGIELKPRLELDTLPAVCDVIATTNLVTVLPTIALQQSLADGRVRAHRFSEPRIARSIAWVHHPRRTVSAAARAVLEIIRHDLLEAAASASNYVQPAIGGAGRRQAARRTKSR
ncbi:LysR family transcriptional regulator [Bradyrhizobium sp. 179]|uniref:LysR family transcriptional regulator n=1 Tax=Bradyrhizobium sp. 179 TaxID=2782648 RepID=UPI001FF9AEB5|nr:LysR family transcriptional regulator [Bradyrhizobium sp. 179]MCK1540962.1 LysR family transcriptional regulator [Bradyrhizobium sp. 179]